MERNDECADARGRVSTAAANEDVEHAAMRLAEFDPERFRRIVRSSLQGARLGVADEHDLSQVVLLAVVRQARRGRLPPLEPVDDLWRWLWAVARRNAARLRAREQRLQRTYLDAALRRTSSDAEPTDDLISRREHEESLLRRLGNDTLETVARAKLDGETNGEIAARLGVHTRTVERHINRIRERLRRAKAEEKE
jgi:RNA polymerase sigma factor (sigma-70 family)